MNYTYMNVFYTVAKHQNISTAAKELGVTQPAVSRIISSIEEEYHTKLFLRSKNGVTLTKEGLNLFSMIENPLNELDRVRSNLENINNLTQNVFHIGATSVSLHCYLFKMLDVFKEKFPSVYFKIYTDSSSNLMNLVEKGKIDFAFITTPSKGSEQLEVIDIHKIDICLIASNCYKDEIKKRVSIKSLEKYPFVLLNNEMKFREHINHFLLENNTKISPTYEIDSSALLVPFVVNGACLTFVPSQMAEKSIVDGRCFKIDLLEEIPYRHISFVTKKGATQSHIIHEIKRVILKQ